MSKLRRKRAKTWSRIQPHLPKIILALVAVTTLGGGAYFLTRKSPEDHLSKGMALYKAGDAKGATIELKNALQGLPNNAEARYTLGKLHFANNNFQDADKEFTKARELGIKDLELASLHARTLISLGEPKRLLNEFSVPDDAEPLTKATLFAFRARAHLMLKDAAASDTSLNEAESLVPGLAESQISRALLALANGQQDTAQRLIENALEKEPRRADFWLLQGDLQRKLGQADTAMTSYGKAIEIDPISPQMRLARAQLFLDKSELDKAEVDIQAALKSAPQDVLGRYFKAYIAFRRNQLPEALALLQDVLRGAPGFMPAHLLAGTVSVGLGNREAARLHLDKVLGVAPQHPLARKLKAATLADLGDLETARQLLASFGDNAGDPSLNLLQGQIALRQGRYSDAVQLLNKAPESVRQDAKFLTDLAAGMMGSGDKAGAIQALSRAAELDTQSSRPDIYLVMTHVREKRYDKALQAVDNLAREKPNDPLVHNLRASIYLTQGNQQAARPHLAKALQLKPDYYPAAYNMALLDLQNKDPQAARNRMLQVTQANPKESRAWLMLARLDALAGKEADLLGHLEKAKNADEKNPQPRLALVQYWLGKNDPGKALVEARGALDSTGRLEFNEYIGLALAAQKDHTNARATFTKWAEVEPKNPRAHYRLAQQLALAKDYAAALKSLDRTLALQPDFMEASVSKALVLGKLNRHSEAVTLARSLQSQQPREALGYITEAELLSAQKKFPEAAALFAKAADLDKQTPTAVRALRAYTLAGQAAAGQQFMAQWLGERPNDTTARHQYALSLLQTQRLPEAAVQYRQLVLAQPKDVVAYNNLAWLLGELKDKEAIPVAEQALKLNPDNPATMDTLGWILVNTGQLSKGLGLLEKAHTKAPSAAEIHWHYAFALAKSGNKALARQKLEKLIYSGNDFPQKAQAQQLLNSL